MKTKTLNQKFRFLVLPAAVMTLVIAGALTARARLLVYDGFNYAVGSALTNASVAAFYGGQTDGSFGWAGHWVPQAATQGNATNVAGSMSYVDAAGHTLKTAGNSVRVNYVAYPGTAPAGQQLYRNFNIGTLGGTANNIYSGLSAGTYWCSFMMQFVWQGVGFGSTSNVFNRKGDITFRLNGTTNGGSAGAVYNTALAFGAPNGNNIVPSAAPFDVWSTWTGNDTGNGVAVLGLQRSATEYLTNSVFTVMQMVVDSTTATADTTYVYLDWHDMGIDPGPQYASLTNTTANLTGVNGFRIDANSANAAGTNAVIYFDEFRIGTTSFDVMPIPEPTVFALSGIGALMFMARMRRKV